MRKVRQLFLPSSENSFQPQFRRPKALTFSVALLIFLQVGLNLAFSTSPRILGFATDIRVEDLISATNREREKEGLSPLRENPNLAKAAQKKAEYMFEKDFWAHVAPDGTTPWDFFKSEGYNFYFAGENLAKDFNTSGGVVSAWMGSGPHRENLLNSQFSEIGLAAVDGRLLGHETTLVVQFLGKPLPPVAGVGVEEEVKEEVVEAEIPPSEVLKPAGVRVALARPTFASVRDLGPTQRVYLPLLFSLAGLFFLDSFVLFRRRQVRVNSHSMLHAFSIGISILAVVFGRGGMIL